MISIPREESSVARCLDLSTVCACMYVCSILRSIDCQVKLNVTKYLRKPARVHIVHALALNTMCRSTASAKQPNTTV